MFDYSAANYRNYGIICTLKAGKVQTYFLNINTHLKPVKSEIRGLVECLLP